MLIEGRSSGRTQMLNALLNIAGLAAITMTLLPLIRSDAWWIRVFDFPRIQIAITIGLIFAGDLGFRTETGLRTQLLRTALGLCLVYQAFKIRPYTRLARKQVQKAKRPRQASTLSLLLANVEMNNRDSEKLKEIVADSDPDVILLVEPDQWWQNAVSDWVGNYPFTVQRPQNNTYGMLLYSRLELVRPEIRFLIEKDVPSIRARVKLPGGAEVELHCLHPKPPVPQETAQSTERDAELMVVGKEVKTKNLPIVVFGDLNDVAWSHTTLLFQKISGSLDPRIGRGFYNSFHARYFFLRFPLDHFFHSAQFRLIELKRLAYFHSDHFPMYIRLSYEPEAERHQDMPEPGRSEQAQAAEKIQNVSKP